MKSIIIFTIKLFSKLLGIIKWPLDRLIYFLNVFIIYLSGRECEKLSDCLMLVKLKANQPPASDRFIEYPWLLENINVAHGRLLDIGSTIGDQLYETLPNAIEINCLNLSAKKFKSQEIKFKQGDIRKTDYPADYFDVITCISTLEHIGVAGRYLSDFDEQGDLKAMREIKKILKPGGVLLATVPYGAKDLLPINKLYNKNRTSNLLTGFNIIDQEFRKFDKTWHVWLKVSEAEAAKTDMLKDGWYALCLIKAIKN